MTCPQPPTGTTAGIRARRLLRDQGLEKESRRLPAHTLPVGGTRPSYSQVLGRLVSLSSACWSHFPIGMAGLREISQLPATPGVFGS